VRGYVTVTPVGNVQTTVTDSSIVAWLIGVGSSAVIFFLAWGLKDVKARYDKVPTLETEIATLKAEMEMLKSVIDRRGLS
jgi:hypothetical protein